MRKLLLSGLLLFCLPGFSQQSAPGKYVLVIHGGAGTILRSQMNPEREKAYQAGLDSALSAGQRILARGGSALDAVEAAVRVMEDNPLFNSGKGAVFTNAGTNEMDAAIMDGRNLMAGSVAGVKAIRNPISTARAVMERSAHVMLTGKGAEEFAAAQGQELVDPGYFYTESRWRGLLQARKADSLKQINEGKTPDHGSLPAGHQVRQPENRDDKYGTVGAVALDRQGNLAAATSTGGMTNKKYGRVGDAPIIGAGTYANNQTAAISCTGWGEYYIRLVLAKTISDMMEYGKMGLEQASSAMIMKQLPELGGDGGLIGVDKQGNVVMPFNTEGMYRGYVKEDQEKLILIYK